MPFLRAERARCDGARSMRAVKGSLGHSLIREAKRGRRASLDGRRGINTGAIPRERERASLERAVISFDARCERQSGSPRYRKCWVVAECEVAPTGLTLQDPLVIFYKV